MGGVVVVAVPLLGLLMLWRIDDEAVRTAVQLDAWRYLVLASGASLASALFKIVAWRGVLGVVPAIGPRVRIRDLGSPILVGAMFNSLLAARVGEVARVFLAKRRLQRNGVDVPTHQMAASVAVETVTSLLVWVVLVLAFGALLPLPDYAWISAGVVGAAALGLSLLALRTPPRISPSRHHAARVRRLLGRARHELVRVRLALRHDYRALRRPGRAAVVGGAQLASWLAQWMVIWAVVRAFGFSDVGLAGSALLLVTTTAAQAVQVLPGNLVTFQAAAALPLVGSYNVPASEAVAFALVLQLAQLVVVIAAGALCLLGERRSLREVRRRGSAEPGRARRSVALGDSPR